MKRSETHLVNDLPELCNNRALLLEAVLVARRFLERAEVQVRRAADEELQLPGAEERERRTFAESKQRIDEHQTNKKEIKQKDIHNGPSQRSRKPFAKASNFGAMRSTSK